MNRRNVDYILEGLGLRTVTNVYVLLSVFELITVFTYLLHVDF